MHCLFEHRLSPVTLARYTCLSSPVFDTCIDESLFLDIDHLEHIYLNALLYLDFILQWMRDA
jgi:hypothetical protein